MACYHPLYLKDKQVAVSCGQCIGCRLEYSRQWAVRCYHESKLSKDNAFVTLTYDDDHLPPHGSLRSEDLRDFFKRLRRRIEPRRVRYFACGEYGSISARPHYHACLFGFDFADKKPFTVRGEHTVYTSEFLRSVWPDGLSEIGAVSFESAAYVARYVLKKVTGRNWRDAYLTCDEDTGEVWEREREFCRMSTKPGIGAGFYEKYHCEIYPSDGVVVRGKIGRPPRYYDKLYERARGDLAAVKEKRLASFKSEDQTWKRLEVRERVVNSQRKERGL